MPSRSSASKPKRSTPEAFAAAIRADVDKWAKVMNQRK
jgi:tripartite-type tricarboxylate transporter receptor subunit TctC